MTLKAIEELGLNQRAAVRCKNFFALGLVYWMYNRDARRTRVDVDRRQKFRQDAEIARRQPARAQGRLQLRRDGRAVRRTATKCAQAKIAPGRYSNISGNEALGARLRGRGRAERARAVPRQLSDHARLGHPARAGAPEALRRAHVPGRRRDRRRVLRRSARPTRARWRSPPPAVPASRSRPRRSAWRSMLELPLVIVDVQRGGPEHGHAHQDRAGRPAAGDVRPQRRVAAAGRRRAQPGRLLLRGDRSVPHRGRRHMTPVVLLSDGYIANSAEPWRCRT